MTEPGSEVAAVSPAPRPEGGAELILYKGLALDAFQAEAIHHIEKGRSVLVAAPTGAGKTLIAEYAIDRALQLGRRLIYTAPIKALSNQKFRDFTREHGERVGILTGDVVLNGRAQVLIMTTEIFRNTLLDDPTRLDDVEYVIFDEVHFMDDPERGTVWEESIIFAPPQVRFLCLSATIPNLRHFAAWIRRIRGSPVEIVEERRRPVPLEHQLWIDGAGLGTLEDLKKMEAEWREGRPAHRDASREPAHGRGHGRGRDRGQDREREDDWRRLLLDQIQEQGRLPCLYFLFNRRECRERALENRGRRLLDAGSAARARAMVDGLAEKFGLGPDSGVNEIRELAEKGIAYHHAGVLPTIKEIVERLFTSGLIRLLFATETFAMGVNMPARSVVFDTLHKFDGVRRGFLKTREYQQMAGRAGRRGMDPVGWVYAHVEWPMMGYGPVARILQGETEPVRSQFNLSYATLLNLYARLGKDIYKACEKSYSNFCEGGGEGAGAEAGEEGGPEAGGARRRQGRERRPARERRTGRGRLEPREGRAEGFSGMVDQVKRRLNALAELGYLEGRRPTPKGELAARIYGYEIQVAELMTAGLFDACSEDQLNVLFCAVVFEAKKGDWYRRPTPEMLPAARRKAFVAIDRVVAAERSCGVRTPTKTLDFKLAAAIWSWSRGCNFVDLARQTSASDGDLVRNFRLVLQLERQVIRALGPQDRLSRKLERCTRKLDRDVVDAERQLRQE